MFDTNVSSDDLLLVKEGQSSKRYLCPQENPLFSRRGSKIEKWNEVKQFIISKTFLKRYHRGITVGI
jgi:hypothetical protein